MNPNLVNDVMGQCLCNDQQNGRPVIATATSARPGEMTWRPGDRPGQAMRFCSECATGFLIAVLASSRITGPTIVSSNNCRVTHADLSVITRMMLDARMSPQARAQLRTGKLD